MLENIWLAIIGAVGACLINTVLIWWFLKGWIHDECKAEGPDYIHGHYRGRLVFMSAVMMAVLLVFLVLDIAWFSRTGLMRDAVRKVPGLSGWGDVGVLVWPLWSGAFLGLLLGAMVGASAAVYGFPKRNLKCRRVLRFLSGTQD